MVPRYFGRGLKNTRPNGEEAIGGEMYENAKWRELSKTVPSDGLGLFLILAGDGVLASGRAEHPLYFSLANAPLAYREFATRIMSLQPVPHFRRAHGKAPEGIKPPQHKV